MSKSIRLLLTIHNHQPSGNFDHVISDAVDRAYMPMLRCLEKHPGINLTLHYSGTLFSWLETHRPDFMQSLRELVRQGRIELLSGTYYEAILAGIPESDRVGQINRHNQYLRHNFGYEAKGMWLTEKVWEADMPKAIEQASIRYTLIDEENFALNGVCGLPVRGYYNTENEGHTVGIFPISRQAGKYMLYKEPEEMLQYLLDNLSDNDQDMILIADDGEKYRTDLRTVDEDINGGWLDRFFTLLEDNSDRIVTNTMKQYWDNIPPQGIAYFSSGSYNDMQYWSLHNEQQEIFREIQDFLNELPDPEKYRPFIRGGIWRNFMSKYAESNWMQKRVQHISRKFHLLENQFRNKNRLRHIRDTLWQAMGNDVYWHGHYGGIYLPHLRDAAWKSIIAAEKLVEERLYNLNDEEFVHSEADFDRDGHLEIQLSTKKYTAIFSKKYSGALVEFDHKRSGFNLFDSIRRYPEQYHNGIPENAEHYFPDDSYFNERYVNKGRVISDNKPRYGLMERFFDSHITVEGLHANAYEEASDFVNETVDICHNNCDRNLVFERRGWINWQRAKVKKNILMGRKGFEVEYKLYNVGIGANEFSFGPEFNFALHSGEDGEKEIFSDADTGGAGYRDFADLREVKEYGFINRTKGLKVTMTFSESVRLLQYPVEVIIKTQQGFEKIYQNTCVLPLWQISLSPGKKACLKMDFIIEDLK